jgi:hypothetical protein
MRGAFCRGGLTFCLLGLVPLGGGGCANEQVRFSAVRLAAKIPEIYQEQVLQNLARTADNPGALPFLALLNGGTTSVTDKGTLAAGFAGGPHRRTIGTYGPFGAERDVQDNVTFDPVRDPDRLRAMRCAYLLSTHPRSTDVSSCIQILQPYLHGQRLEDVVPQGWLHIGCKKDDKRGALYVARHGDTYIWVMPRDLDALTRLTLFILNIATLDTKAKAAAPAAPTAPGQPGASSAGVAAPALPNAPQPRIEAPTFNPGLLLVPRP